MANSIFIELTLEDKGTPEIRKFSAETEKHLKKAEKAHTSFAEKVTGSMARAAGSAKTFSDRVLGLNERATQAVTKQKAFAQATRVTREVMAGASLEILRGTESTVRLADAMLSGAASASAFSQELGNVASAASAAGSAASSSSVSGPGTTGSLSSSLKFKDAKIHFGSFAKPTNVGPPTGFFLPPKSARHGFSGLLSRDTVFQAHRGERVEIDRPGRRGGSGGDSFTINIDARGADLDERRVAQKVEAAILRLKRRRHSALARA